LHAAGRIYLFDEENASRVIEATPDGFRLLAENPLDNGCMASPAVLNDALILRTKTHLYRIEEMAPPCLGADWPAVAIVGIAGVGEDCAAALVAAGFGGQRPQQQAGQFGPREVQQDVFAVSSERIVGDDHALVDCHSTADSAPGLAD
jgi:hypothetical protein